MEQLSSDVRSEVKGVEAQWGKYLEAAEKDLPPMTSVHKALDWVRHAVGLKSTGLAKATNILKEVKAELGKMEQSSPTLESAEKFGQQFRKLMQNDFVRELRPSAKQEDVWKMCIEENAKGAIDGNISILGRVLNADTDKVKTGSTKLLLESFMAGVKNDRTQLGSALRSLYLVPYTDFRGDLEKVIGKFEAEGADEARKKISTWEPGRR